MPTVALVMHPTAMLYEAAIAAEALGVDRSDLSPAGDWYDFWVATQDGRPHPWLPASPTTTWDDIGRFDGLVVPSTTDPDSSHPARLVRALRRAAEGGAWIAALCTGAFVLAEAGLLDGRVATTHWMHAADLARRYPLIDVRADVLYIDDGDVLTSAGKTAALDLCLHLVRRDFGAATANGLARRLVMPAHRSGGQAQFIAPPRSPSRPQALGATLEWARQRLDQPLTVDDLARHAGLSTRHLGRRMATEIQSTPLAWLQRERLTRAQELLERSDASVEQVAQRCGMGTAATLRRHFQRSLGTSPTDYRTTFRERT
jgi:transcriptional regulator GlxA family with amidase domain